MVDKISNSSGICFPRAEWRINHFLCRYNYSVALLRRVWDVGYEEKLHQTLFSSLCVASGKQHMLRFSAFSHFWSVFLFRPTCCSLRFECCQHIGRRCMQKTQKKISPGKQMPVRRRLVFDMAGDSFLKRPETISPQSIRESRKDPKCNVQSIYFRINLVNV